jgi:hypothetical protein
LNLSPNYFSCIEDYLSKFKTLIILCEECEIKLEEEHCIYIILPKLCSAYVVFVPPFYSMREALGKYYQKHTLESFCDALIKEKYNLVQLGVISIVGTSNKALVAQKKDNPIIPRSNILSTTTSNIRVPNPLGYLQLLMVTKERNLKIRRLTNIPSFVINMVMMSPNFSRRW